MCFQSIPSPCWLFLFEVFLNFSFPLKPRSALAESFMCFLVPNSEFLGNMLQEVVAEWPYSHK